MVQGLAQAKSDTSADLILAADAIGLCRRSRSCTRRSQNACLPLAALPRLHDRGRMPARGVIVGEGFALCPRGRPMCGASVEAAGLKLSLLEDRSRAQRGQHSGAGSGRGRIQNLRSRRCDFRLAEMLPTSRVALRHEIREFAIAASAGK